MENGRALSRHRLLWTKVAPIPIHLASTVDRARCIPKAWLKVSVVALTLAAGLSCFGNAILRQNGRPGYEHVKTSSSAKQARQPSVRNLHDGNSVRHQAFDDPAASTIRRSYL
jgi:hypothetical protein